MAQELSIGEYFIEAKHSQKDFMNNRYEYAKAYLTNHDYLSGLSIREFVATCVADKSCTASDVFAKYALMQLNEAIENDLMEAVAEIGVNSLKAIREDDEERQEAEEAFRYFGYCAYPPQTNVTELSAFVDIAIVPLVSRLGHIRKMDPNYNPFQTAKMPVKDYDKMTESEWQAAKDEEERIKASNLLLARYDEALEEQKLHKRKSHKYKSIPDREYPDWVLDA